MVVQNEFLAHLIKNISDNTLFFKTKTGWNNFWMLSENALDLLAQVVIDEVKHATSLSKLKEPKNYDTELKTNFSITELAIGVPENNLERVIAMFSTNVKNQIPTCDGGHVDLFYQHDKECSIIELKQWITDNNPLYAIVELVKNYYLLFHTKENESVMGNYQIGADNDVINLILLAPKDYYRSYAKGKGYRIDVLKNYFEFIKKLNNKLNQTFNKNGNIKISLKYIDVTRDMIESKIQSTTKVAKNTPNSIIECNWLAYFDDFTVSEKSLLRDWVEIKNAETWQSLCTNSNNRISV